MNFRETFVKQKVASFAVEFATPFALFINGILEIFKKNDCFSRSLVIFFDPFLKNIF